MRMVVIGDSDFVVGFQLAGVSDVYECSSNYEVTKAIEKIRNLHDLAVIIIQRSYAIQVRKFIDEWKLKKGIYPVIIELPDYQDRAKLEDPMREIIKRAIGIDIMKR